MLGGIVEELVAYNPTAGAVFGIEADPHGALLIAPTTARAPYIAAAERRGRRVVGRPARAAVHGDTNRNQRGRRRAPRSRCSRPGAAGR